MIKKTNYTDGPIGDLKIIKDFLPPPSELVFKEEQEKVTIVLSKSSVNFFRTEAKRNNTQYQRMIRNLLDLYVSQHQ